MPLAVFADPKVIEGAKKEGEAAECGQIHVIGLQKRTSARAPECRIAGGGQPVKASSRCSVT